MGLLAFLKRLFFGRSRSPLGRRRHKYRKRARLVQSRREIERWKAMRGRKAAAPWSVVSKERPYRFAHADVMGRGYLDLTKDGRPQELAARGLPLLATPDDLATWLGVSTGKLAWLVYRFTTKSRPDNVRSAHYHYRWLRKRGGGFRLIEAPKSTLKRIQTQILDEILARIPPHPSAHGFVPDRSIVTNAAPHVGQFVLYKIDLENFYANVRFARAVAVYRSIGYAREAAIWLARLTTTAIPPNMPFPENDAKALKPYLSMHLPQGAPTSPALANLSAFSLDVRLSGLARSFGANYTRYADDVTISGPREFIGSLRAMIPLIEQVIRQERFRVNKDKRRVVRQCQRQVVTGVVVNKKINVNRRDFDRLKAILTNCVRHGPASQNREQHENFAEHLRGRIAHVEQLSPKRAEKLFTLYCQIDWTR